MDASRETARDVEQPLDLHCYHHHPKYLLYYRTMEQGWLLCSGEGALLPSWGLDQGAFGVFKGLKLAGIVLEYHVWKRD